MVYKDKVLYCSVQMFRLIRYQFVVCISLTLRQVHSHGFAFLLQVVTRVAALVLIVVVVVVVRLNQIKVLNFALLKGTVPLHQRLQ